MQQDAPRSLDDDGSAEAGKLLAQALADTANAAREYVEAATNADLKLALYAGEIAYDPFAGYYRYTDNGGFELPKAYQRWLNDMQSRGEIIVSESGAVELA